ncbi:MAG: chalcone isomerase family protein [Deltaproteobacteria bacterium]|nr:chalcone isomerase family protein [Deltaproteobacteria bacterium]
MRKFLVFAFLFLFASPAGAATLEGVTMPDTMQVGGKSLVLNGMGVRKKFVVKVYVAGLYLPSKMNSSEKVLAGDTERGLDMHFLHDVEKAKMCKAWYDGLKNNSPAKEAALKAQFDTLCSYMSDMAEGDKMTFTYVPGQGTTVSVRGKEKGTIAGKDFADAMFSCWIGPNPPGADFKQGLLGG